MATESYAQLEQLWDHAGGDPAKAPIAAAIAEAESSGRTDATSRNPDGGTNVGLWQLDTPGGKGAGYSIAQLMNPQTNAAAAVRGSSNGTDWSAWQTWAQGTYKQFLGGKNSGSGSGAKNSGGGSGGGGGFNLFNPSTWFASATTGVEHFAVHYGAIAIVVVGGGALVVAGLFRATGHKAPNPVTIVQGAAKTGATAAALA